MSIKNGLTQVAGMVTRDSVLLAENPAQAETEFATPIQLGQLYFESQTADYEIKVGEVVLADVESVGSFTVDLPAAPLVNQKCGVILKTKMTFGRGVTINPNGKNINGSSANILLNVQGWGLILQYDGVEWRIISDLRTPVRLRYEEQQTSATNGGTFTSGAARTRVLNTEVIDEGGNGSLSSNQITLDPGTYRILELAAPAYDVGNHIAWLYDTSDSAVVAVASNEWTTPGTSDVLSYSRLAGGTFTIAAQKTFEVQHECSTTVATTGFGIANSRSPDSIGRFTAIELEKIS